MPYIEAVLGITAVLIGGYPLALNAFRALKRKQLNVDALVIIASGAALFLGDFLEAATVIFILLLGEELEEYTISKSQTAIRGLAHLLPRMVRILDEKGAEHSIPIEQLKEGMILLIKPGERVAVDGEVIAGASFLDQSPITGESKPIGKRAGDNVFSGSINLDGSIQVKAVSVGEETTVAHIRRLIEEAKREKAPIQRIVDKYSTWFVPTVLFLALIVYAVTGDLERAVTALIVTCPCAFVLATPIAVVSAIGNAAKRGILVKGGAVLEKSAHLDSFVFDKTGTLTHGHPEIVKIKTVCPMECSNEDTLTFAAVAEKLSEHPLAEAILDKAKEWELLISTPDEFLVKPGLGVLAQHEDINIVLGNRSLLSENDIHLTPDIEEYIKERESKNETVLLVAHHKQVCGVISLTDTLRESAPDTIKQLKGLGINRTIALYTGDNLEIAKNVAQQLGMDEFEANLMPWQKVEKVKELIGRGYNVGMVGDGINDAPALAASHVGIAMGVSGSELAVNASDVALLTNDLTLIPQIIRLGRMTFSIIKQNVIFALIFNAAMLYLASAGILTMIAGAVSHQISSLAVILNSMRLIYFNTEKTN